MNRSDVFLSYRRKDVEFTKKIDQALKATKREVWVDWEDIPPGVAGFTDEIQQGIEGADAFIAILSPDYLDSEYCKMELAEAVKLNKRLIPIVLKKFDGYEVPNGIGHINWVYFTPHAGQENTWDEAWPKVIQALETDFAHAKEHTRLMLRAKEWETSQHETSYLLQGTELDDAESWMAQGTTLVPKPLPMHSEYILQSRKYETTRQRRQRALLSAGLVVSLVLLAAAVVLGIFAEQNRREAEQNRREAEYRTQIVEAEAVAWDAELALTSLEPEKAAPLALFAVDNYPARPYTEEVLGMVATYQSLRGIIPNVVDYHVEVNQAVVQVDDNTLELVNLATNEVIWTVQTPKIDRIHDVSSQYLIFEYETPAEGIIILRWDDGTTLFQQDGFEVGDVILSPDGSRLAIMLRGIGLLLMNTATWETITQLDRPGYFVQPPKPFSPDSAHLVYATETTTLLINTADGTIQSEQPVMDRDQVHNIEWSASSRGLAYVPPLESYNNPNQLVMVDVAKGKYYEFTALSNFAWLADELLVTDSSSQENMLFTVQTGQSRPLKDLIPGTISQIAKSYDSKYVAFPLLTDNGQNTIEVWDATNATSIHTFTSLLSNAGKLSWTNDSEWLWYFSINDDGQAREFELLNLSTKSQARMAINNVQWLVPDYTQIISPDHLRLVSHNSLDLQISPQIFDIQTGQLLYTIPAHNEEFQVAWSPDGKYLVTYGQDRRFSVYMADTGIHILSGTTPNVPERVMWFTSNSHDLNLGLILRDATETDLPTFDLRIFSLNQQIYDLHESGTSVPSTLLPQIMDSGIFTQDGSQLLAVHNDGITYRYTVDTNHDLRAEVTASLPEVYTPAIMPEGYVAFWQEQLLKTYGYVPDWTAQIEENYTALPDLTFSATWSPDGTLIATGHFGKSEDYGFTADSRRSVGVGTLGTVRIWDAETNTLLQTFGGKVSDGSITDVAWSPDGQKVLGVDGFGKLKVWNVTTGETLLDLQAHESWAEVAEWSPDGKRIVTVSTDHTAKVWDSTTGELLVTFDKHIDWVRDADWSPDGTQIVTAGWDKLLYVWDSTTGKVITRYDGHSDSVNTVDWSPNGQRIVSGGWDSTAQIWDAQTGDLLLILRGHQGPVNSVYWGKAIVTVGLDNTMRIWQAWESRDELEAIVRKCCVLQDLSAEDTASYQSAE